MGAVAFFVLPSLTSPQTTICNGVQSISEGRLNFECNILSAKAANGAAEPLVLLARAHASKAGKRAVARRTVLSEREAAGQNYSFSRGLHNEHIMRYTGVQITGEVDESGYISRRARELSPPKGICGSCRICRAATHPLAI
jgi:hypothetical protein